MGIAGIFEPMLDQTRVTCREYYNSRLQEMFIEEKRLMVQRKEMLAVSAAQLCKEKKPIVIHAEIDKCRSKQ